MFIIFTSLAVLGVTTFIVQALSRSPVILTQTMSTYLAQAGIHYAIYQYRFGGSFPSGQVNIDANNYFVLNVSGGATLSVDASVSSLADNGKDIVDVTIKNNSTTQSIIIDWMIVTWTGVSGRELRQIRIGQDTVFQSAHGESSPADADISDFTLSPNTTYPINRLRFDGDMTGATVTVNFVMKDGSTTGDVQVYPANSSSSGGSYTILSTGKTTGSSIYRTIQAVYNSSTGKITGYGEIATQVVP